MAVLGCPVEGLYVYDYSGDLVGRPREFALFRRSDTEFEEQMIIQEQPLSYSRYLELTDAGLFEVGSAVGSDRGYEDRRLDSPLLMVPSPVVVGAAWAHKADSQAGWVTTHNHRSLAVTDVAPTTWQGRPDFLVTVREVLSDDPPPPPTPVVLTPSRPARASMESIRIYLASRCMLMSETIVLPNAQVSTREIASFPSS